MMVFIGPCLDFFCFCILVAPHGFDSADKNVSNIYDVPPNCLNLLYIFKENIKIRKFLNYFFTSELKHIFFMSLGVKKKKTVYFHYNKSMVNFHGSISNTSAKYLK